MPGSAPFRKSRRFGQSFVRHSDRTATVPDAGEEKHEQMEDSSSTYVLNRHHIHKAKLSRTHSERGHEGSLRRGGVGSVGGVGGGRHPADAPREVPDFCEGIDQKVLPLPMRPPPQDWVYRLPGENSYEMRILAESLAADQREVLQHGFFTRGSGGETAKPSSLNRIFLDAVERGDKSTVTRCLRCPQPVNVNCTNMLGRTAIQIAVDNENFEIVELLLQEPNIRIGDALLYAIQEGVYRIVEMLIDHHSITKEVLGTSWSKRVSRSEESHDFSADISPVILASICNQFEILQLLLSRGARIERPHRSNCSCNDCIMMNREDSLKYSLWRMNTYRALASPAWISLTSPDPVLAAFKLSWELCNLASRENEFKEVFIQLSEQCKKYACDLLDQCRSTEEVLAVLSKSSDSSDEEEAEKALEEPESSKRDFDIHPDGNTELRHLGRVIVRHYQRRLYGEENLFSRPPSSTPHRVASGHDMHRIDVLPEALHHQTTLGRSSQSQYTILEDLYGAHEVALDENTYFGRWSDSIRSPLRNSTHERLTAASTEDGHTDSRKNNSRMYSKDEEYDFDYNNDRESRTDMSKRAADREEDGEDEEENDEDEEPNVLRLDRLKLAIKYEQKRFVAHPHCQHILTSLWYDQLPGWRKHHPTVKLLFCLAIVLALPLLALIYLIHPRGSVGRFLRSPMIKFVNHSASIAMFLALLLIASTDGQSIKALEQRQQTRGPDPNRIELLILWWVAGFVWSEMKQIWEEGFKAYVRQWWNWLDFIMLTLFLTTVGLRLVSLVLRKTEKYGFELTGRQNWPPDDPTLLSEAFFAIAHIFSFARIIFLFQVNEQLGPLQISLGNMLIDITKFLFIFLLVITSFACGLHQLYYYYVTETNDMRPEAFSSLIRSYQALFWYLFGVSPVGQYRLQLKDESGKLTDLKSGRVTVTVAEILLMIYHTMAIIVLVNMLIAMMSNSFQLIQNQADTEWKFARSKLWLGYFDEGSTLPPPLNTIVSPKAVWRFLRGVYRLLTCASRRHKSASVKPSETIPKHFSNHIDTGNPISPRWASAEGPKIKLPSIPLEKIEMVSLWTC
uniref:Transient-receptor-potential-like protein n=1 Tax=Schistocephalus solidus TaxID=70667 RepID=A0A0X3PE78_SCHSO